ASGRLEQAYVRPAQQRRGREEERPGDGSVVVQLLTTEPAPDVADDRKLLVEHKAEFLTLLQRTPAWDETEAESLIASVIPAWNDPNAHVPSPRWRMRLTLPGRTATCRGCGGRSRTSWWSSTPDRQRAETNQKSQGRVHLRNRRAATMYLCGIAIVRSLGLA